MVAVHDVYTSAVRPFVIRLNGERLAGCMLRRMLPAPHTSISRNADHQTVPYHPAAAGKQAVEPVERVHLVSSTRWFSSACTCNSGYRTLELFTSATIVQTDLTGSRQVISFNSSLTCFFRTVEHRRCDWLPCAGFSQTHNFSHR